MPVRTSSVTDAAGQSDGKTWRRSLATSAALLFPPAKRVYAAVRSLGLEQTRLREQQDRLADELASLSRTVAERASQPAQAGPSPGAGNGGDLRDGSHHDWLRMQVEREGYWFHRIELAPDLVTPGWSDPLREKLPHFGLPESMSGMRVLDIGCSEGFFSFEAERRGAREVIAIDSSPDSVRRFNICRAALDSRATAFLTNVYDLTRRGFGTYDLIMFFGVLYHLRNPILALEKIFSVCCGTLLLQTHGFEDPAVGEQSMARFYPFGIESGAPEKRSWDPTVFWIPNGACVRDMLAHVGFEQIERLPLSAGHVFRAQAPVRDVGTPPDHSKAPWS